MKSYAPIVHWQHYKEFGHTGIAYESRLGVYNEPNKTLSSMIEGKSRKGGGIVMVRLLSCS